MFRNIISTKVFLIILLATNAWANENSNPDEVVAQCTNGEGSAVAENCIDFIESLYLSCPDPEYIADATNGNCVPIRQFRTPLIGCSQADCEKVRAYAEYVPFAYDAATDIYKVEGSLGAETIVLFLQGGPDAEFRDYYANFLEHKFLVAYIAQTSFIKPGLLDTYDMTVDEAELEIEENIKLIDDAYRDLRIRFPDRKFAIVGHSMGAFLAQKYVAEHGNSFDRIVLMAGRLDAPLDWVRRFAIGQNLVFDHVGDRESFRQRLETYSLTPFHSYLVRGYEPNSVTALLAAIGWPRYTNLLDSFDLSNMLYVYSAKDEATDRLSDDEIGFLISHGAEVLETGWDPDYLGHSRMLLIPDHLERIVGFIEGQE